MAITDLFVSTADQSVVQYPSWGMRISVSDVAPNLKTLLNTRVKVRKVSRTAGGNSLDYANIEWMQGGPLVNRVGQPLHFVARCDVLLPATLAFGESYFIDPFLGADAEMLRRFWLDENNIRLFLGDYLVESETVGDTEILTGKAAVVDTYFGNTVDGMEYAFNTGLGVVGDTVPAIKVGTEIVFNPTVDGVVRGNRASLDDEYYWVTPETADSVNAEAEIGQTPELWTLPDALNKLFKTFNRLQKYIRNPEINAADSLWYQAPPLVDLHFESGHYLPFYLDALLHPLGYNWWVEPQTEFLAATDRDYLKPIIVIFRKGVSPVSAKELNFQAPEYHLDLSQSNVSEYKIDRMIDSCYNCVRVLGDKIRVELTLPLYPGWQVAEDAFTEDELSIKNTDGVYRLHTTAHRLWIANEWSGYHREAPYPVNNTVVPDLGAILGVYSPSGTGTIVSGELLAMKSKRVIEPPLTWQGFGSPKVRRDVLLEFSADAGTTWIEVSSKIGGWAVLPDQIGIIFTDDAPPTEMMAAFATGDLRMRITGTIQSDHNLYNLATDSWNGTDPSAIARQRRLTMDKSDQFRHWYVLGRNAPVAGLNASTYASVLAADAAGSDTHDDRIKLRDYAASMLRNVRHAEYDGECVLPGIHTTYQIGDLISKINGREIGLNQSVDPADPRYMQVTGVEWEFDDEAGPMTRLILDRGLGRGV